MATLPVLDATGKQVGTYEVEPTDFAPRINKQVLHDAVVMYQRNLRHGSAKTKSRAEVEGSTRKLYRQKGTGRARAGAIRTPTRRGGGHAFAKRPRDWTFRHPRKMLQLATRMAIASKVRDNQILLLDDLKLSAPKTKEIANLLKAINCSGQSVLLATTGHDAVVYKSARNIPRVQVSSVADLNAYNVLLPRWLVVTKAGLESLKVKAKSGE